MNERAVKVARIYFSLQKMKELSKFYLFSFRSFVDIFQYNINSFTEAIIEEICKGLPIKFQVIGPLLIAEAIYQKWPFNLLFSRGL